MGLFGPNIEKLIDNDDVDGLLKLLGHRKPKIRLGALLALSRKRDEYVLSRLRPMIDDPDDRVKTIATLKFGEITDPKTLTNLRDIIITGSQTEKIEALRVLGGRGQTDNAEISKILYLALNDKNQVVRIQSIRTMGAIKDRYSIKHLIDCLDDKKFQIRLEATKALGAVGGEVCVDPLIGSLVDNHGEVRRAADAALRQVGTEKALNAVTDAPFMLLVKKMTENESVRLETVINIGRLKIKEGAPLLHKSCMDEYKNIRLESLRAVGQLRDKTAVDTVNKLVEDPFYDVRLEAVKTLEKLFHPGALRGIEKAMKDTNKNVRLEAIRAYNSLKTRLEKAAE
ncbi:MAG TPA: HEAT repeat domain-containing protein [Spirochaetota bacterium]|nr:HEAT repeat domain-containing protein [Spirochaetota bacterium]